MQETALSSEDMMQIRKQIINMVLGTDMKKHFDIVSRFQVSFTRHTSYRALRQGHSRDSIQHAVW